MGIFSKNKKKEKQKEDIEQLETDVSNEVDSNSDDEEPSSDSYNETTESTKADESLDDKVDMYQSFLRGSVSDYILHLYTIIDSEDFYETILESMHRDHLKDTELPYQLYTLKSPSDEDIVRFRNGLYFFQFMMDYEPINQIPFDLDEDFKTNLLSVLYIEIFESEPLLKDYILEATAFNGDDYVADEEGNEQRVIIAPTLNIIFKPGVSEDIVIQCITKLYNQLQVYGYVVTSDSNLTEPKESDYDFSDFNQQMDAILTDDEVPQFNKDGSLKPPEEQELKKDESDDDASDDSKNEF